MELRAGSKTSVKPALGDHQRETATADEQREGRDDRLDPETRDQHAVDHADGSATDQCDRDRHGRSVAQVQRQQRGGDRHDRADGEVDASRADDQRHPERDDGDGDDLHELQADVVHLGEARREHQIEGDQEQESRVDASLGDPVEDLLAADRRPARGQLSGRHRRCHQAVRTTRRARDPLEARRPPDRSTAPPPGPTPALPPAALLPRSARARRPG